MVQVCSITPTVNNHSTVYMGMKHCTVHSPIEMCISGKNTMRRTIMLDSENGNEVHPDISHQVYLKTGPAHMRNVCKYS